MSETTFAELQQTYEAEGPEPAFDRMEAALRESKDYHRLFEAMLMRARHRLGIPLVPLESASGLPAEVARPYEEAIAQACRVVGRLFLDAGNIPAAWHYYRMLGEADPVARAIEAVAPDGDGQELYQVIEVAFQQGVNPRKGFELLLERMGLCQAITLFGSEFPYRGEVREHCLRLLVETIYRDLRATLEGVVQRVEDGLAPGQTIRQLISGRDWLFADDAYHIDSSHLSSVVRYSLDLARDDLETLQNALELTEYGAKLSSTFQYPSETPFEDLYRDAGTYLKALIGQDVDRSIEHFRAKAVAALKEDDTYPAQVLVNLLAKLGRYEEALHASSELLGDRPLSSPVCPSISELCQRSGRFAELAEISRRRGDLVGFAAGLLQAGQPAAASS